MVGLENVDNTTDANKPVSEAHTNGIKRKKVNSSDLTQKRISLRLHSQEHHSLHCYL
jgi:hypothetical protein